jgi:hypothetical protein
MPLESESKGHNGPDAKHASHAVFFGYPLNASICFRQLMHSFYSPMCIYYFNLTSPIEVRFGQIERLPECFACLYVCRRIQDRRQDTNLKWSRSRKAHARQPRTYIQYTAAGEAVLTLCEANKRRMQVPCILMPLS